MSIINIRRTITCSSYMRRSSCEENDIYIEKEFVQKGYEVHEFTNWLYGCNTLTKHVYICVCA